MKWFTSLKGSCREVWVGCSLEAHGWFLRLQTDMECRFSWSRKWLYTQSISTCNNVQGFFLENTQLCLMARLPRWGFSLSGANKINSSPWSTPHYAPNTHIFTHFLKVGQLIWDYLIPPPPFLQILHCFKLCERGPLGELDVHNMTTALPAELLQQRVPQSPSQIYI